MKPAWDRLMADYSDSASSVVGDVDCTVEEDLCSKHNVEGYPTIKHGDPSALEDYTGGREYEDLADFAKGNLGPTCGLKSLDQCSDQEKKDIEQAQALSNDQLLDTLNKTCLLYTSDAADDLLCVDLGGSRIIKKKKIYDLKESLIIQ
eukprot:TRINITY_DN515_c0_g1_i3.p1 TRINITY_DN515_c0_g1~~TRINITY_DN515_c0_g1_i3.p1  ORF type:complete len:148 (+),score=56.40 TRINITY_DN515_c0_g1_i3:395-838(+)